MLSKYLMSKYMLKLHSILKNIGANSHEKRSIFLVELTMLTRLRPCLDSFFWILKL